jgi:phosphopantothenoylcysteine decarboxylase/phosphopantothenate--cysteine ligase
MKIALGVSGGIAAYRAAEFVRLLQQEGVTVQVVMTDHAQEFIRPLTFAALTGEKVITSMFSGEADGSGAESSVEHIALARTIDALVIVPATANLIAKMASGIADDFLTTLYVATKAPVLVAPAMNVNMWLHPATEENVARLREREVEIVEPIEGKLADGMYGPGHLAELETIVTRTLALLGIRRDLAGEKVLVTAGPTCEDIDPVRYITNRSSGKMGYAVAEAARRRGAEVVLVSGPTALTPPERVQVISVRTTEEMRQAVQAALPEATVVVKAAAVADFRAARQAEKKIKKSDGIPSIELEPTPDLLGEITAQKGSRTVVGFAAETDDTLGNARAKLEAKNLDLIVANDVTEPGAGFDADTNIVTILTHEGRQIDLPKMSKAAVADHVLDEVLRLRQGAGANAATRRVRG